VRLLDAQVAGEPGSDRRYQPIAGAGAHQNRSNLVWTHLSVSQRRPRGPQREVLEAVEGVATLLDAGLGTDLVRRHRRPVVGAVTDEVLVGAQNFAVHCGDGLDARLHGQVVSHVEGGVRANGFGNLGRSCGGLLRRVPRFHAGQESFDLAVTGMEDHHVVVVAQFFDLGQGGIATRPRILIVQDHRPAT
jgi:hypothetical protein